MQIDRPLVCVAAIATLAVGTTAGAIVGPAGLQAQWFSNAVL